jgi:WD40 repeat protein
VTLGSTPIALLGVLAVGLGACNEDGPSAPACAEVACLERVLSGHAERVTSVAFSPDGAALASGSTDFTARLWDVASGSTVRTLAGHASSVLSVAFSPDGRLVASGSEDATVRLWRVADGPLVRILADARAGVTALAFTADGRWLLGASSDRTARIWDLETGREVLRVDAHVAPVTALALAPDGRSFATAGATLDGRVRLWSFPAGSPVWQAFGDTAVWSLAFAPSGRVIASGNTFGSVRLRDSADGSELGVLRVGDALVEALAYSNDGRLLAASDASTVRIFDAANGGSLGLLTGHTGTVFDLAFSPDGRLLASASDDRTIRLWRRP